LANLNAVVTADGNLSVYSDAGYRFAFSDDTSNVLAALGMNTFFSGKDASNMEVNAVVSGNYKLIAAARIDGSGDISSGDNANALQMTNLQYQDVSMKRYVYERGNPGSPAEQDVDETLDNYLYALISSIGLRSQSVTRSKEYHEVVANNLQVTRDSISAVSLDEEMANLMKYQQAYTAAAKLITTADEMFQSLIETK
jgi:flagellar hook-associated protein 1 FlgK